MNDREPEHLEWRVSPSRTVALDRPVLMGILNITPDSFSDGGRFLDAGPAVSRALEMIDEGAEIIDVGGESTRPGSRRMPARTQMMRVVPVIRRLRGRTQALISIDTTLAEVAAAAIDAGADLINDTSACCDDTEMAPLAAARGCGLILMHRPQRPEDDSYSDRHEQPPHYDDVVAFVREALRERIAVVTAKGVQHQSIVLDPGLGFGKTVEHNVQLMARISEIGVIEGRTYPVLTGASRKSFIGKISGAPDPQRRIAGTVAANVAQYLSGARLFRVHDVRPHREALAVAEAIANAG